jgi:hypothetical protein
MSELPAKPGSSTPAKRSQPALTKESIESSRLSSSSKKSKAAAKKDDSDSDDDVIFIEMMKQHQENTKATIFSAIQQVSTIDQQDPLDQLIEVQEKEVSLLQRIIANPEHDHETKAECATELAAAELELRRLLRKKKAALQEKEKAAASTAPAPSPTALPAEAPNAPVATATPTTPHALRMGEEAPTMALV